MLFIIENSLPSEIYKLLNELQYVPCSLYLFNSASDIILSEKVFKSTEPSFGE